MGPESIAGLNGPVRSDPPQLNGVVPPGRRGAGDVRAATEGNVCVPPGVSLVPPPAKECSKGFGSNARCIFAMECPTLKKKVRHVQCRSHMTR